MQNKKQAPSVEDLVEGSMQNLGGSSKRSILLPHRGDQIRDHGSPAMGTLELGRKAPLSLKDLAANMHLSPSTVVGVIDRLIARIWWCARRTKRIAVGSA